MSEENKNETGPLTEETEISTNWDESSPTFDSMDLKEDLLRGIYAYGFEKPSAIQQRAVKPILIGRDVIAQAQSGKIFLHNFVLQAMTGLFGMIISKYHLSSLTFEFDDSTSDNMTKCLVLCLVYSSSSPHFLKCMTVKFLSIGTGKTATFAIGILQRLDVELCQCQALVLAPTRELAQQIVKVIKSSVSEEEDDDDDAVILITFPRSVLNSS
jgi:superfamily II DNA/RNA helicase